MAYTKTTWVTGDKVTSTKLNKIEQGIYDNDAACDELKTAITQLESQSGGIANTIENVPIASFDDGTETAVKQIVVGIEPVQSGSGDPAPDNVRPITGWTRANIFGTGANVWDEEWEIGSIDNTTGENNSLGTDRIRSKNYISVKPTTSYCFVSLSENISQFLCFYDKEQNFIGVDGNVTLPLYSFTTPNNCYYIRFRTGNNYGSTYKNDIAINYPSTASTYKAYQGTNYPITFPTAAGTVYGGTLTNLGTDEWKLKVTRANTDIGSLSWSRNEFIFSGQVLFYYFRAALSGSVFGRAGQLSTLLCSKYKAVETNTGNLTQDKTITNFSTNSLVLIRDDSYADADTFKTAMSDTQIVYELATPVEYTITTSEVIQLLAGYNNVWADTGDIKLLEYFADSKTYIDEENALVKALIAKELPSMVADTALTANDFRIVNNTLYRITTSVASGATLTPNTNCTATTITAVLKTLLS